MSIRKALAFSFLDRYAGLLLSIVASIAIARLLTPAEIGAFSVTMVLMSLAATFRDLGAGQYLVQEKDLTPERLRAVWTVLLGIGALLCLFTIGIAKPVAAFYADARIEFILYVLAANYLINPVAGITYAWMMREMRYDALALMRFSSALVGSVTSVYLAWLGWGPISLAWGALANTTAHALVGWVLRPPGFPWLPGLAEVRRVLGFGYRVTYSSALDSLAAAMPELALGKLQSLTAVGLFSRANGLVQMFGRAVSDAVNSVALSMFAKSAREGRGIGDDFVRANAYMTAIAWSFGLFLALMAYPLVRTLYGAQWDDAVLPTRVLGIGLVLTAPGALCYQALLAIGRTQVLVRAATASGGLTCVAAVVGAWYGLLPAVLALCVSSAVGSCVWLAAAHRELRFERVTLLRSVRSSAVVAACSAVIPAVLVATWGWRPEAHHLWLLAAGSLGCAAGFVAGVLLSRHPLSSELSRLARSRAGPAPANRPE